jgi:predicted CDP-diglyceride synthetase/phosphatidate cytidylyltransferase
MATSKDTRVLFENHGQGSAFQELRGAALLVGFFNQTGGFDDIQYFLFGKILGIDKVFYAHNNIPPGKLIKQLKRGFLRTL